MWHFWMAKQRQGTTFIFISKRVPGDEDSPDKSDTDTQLLTFSKANPAQTVPQFVAMVKRETGIIITSLNAVPAESDVSATFAV